MLFRGRSDEQLASVLREVRHGFKHPGEWALVVVDVTKHAILVYLLVGRAPRRVSQHVRSLIVAILPLEELLFPRRASLASVFCVHPGLSSLNESFILTVAELLDVSVEVLMLEEHASVAETGSTEHVIEVNFPNGRQSIVVWHVTGPHREEGLVLWHLQICQIVQGVVAVGVLRMRIRVDHQLQLVREPRCIFLISVHLHGSDVASARGEGQVRCVSDLAHLSLPVTGVIFLVRHEWVRRERQVVMRRHVVVGEEIKPFSLSEAYRKHKVD